MKKIFILIMMGVWVSGCGMVNPKGSTKPIQELKLEKYDFDNLRKRGGVVSEINIIGEAEVINKKRTQKVDFKTEVFTFVSNGKIISGTLNMPNPEMSSLKKAVIMIRGYADREGYYVGSGSWRMADELAKLGYATFSIDFLGFGNSDNESEDMLEARFEKVESVLDLIASVEALPYIDKNNIGIWAHSNGGQIALTVLEVTGKRYPTVLWAPMTQNFPESVLSTIDEGSPVKEAIEEFEKHYDARRYAFENYYHWINAPILILQGTNDAWCKVEWQQSVQSRMKSLGKEVKLSVYKGDDHNLSKDWEEAVGESVEFYETTN